MIKNKIGNLTEKGGYYLFIIPTFLLISIFNYYPIFSAFYHAFFRWDGVNTPTFIGLGHFRELFTVDRAFLTSLPNMAKLGGFSLAVAVTIPLFAALLISNLRNNRIQYIYRILFVIPMVVPWMVTIMIWRFIYDPINGLLNNFLNTIGLDVLAQSWLGNPRFSLLAIMFINFPWIAGFNLLIYLAGLDNISPAIFDSAAIDGVSSGISRWMKIDIPLIMGQMKIIVVLTVIDQIERFQAILILTNGGPGFSTYVPGLVLYKNAFMYSKMGNASAIGLFLFLLIFLITVLNIKYIKSSAEYGT